MEEQELICLINRSIEESAQEQLAMRRKPQSATREAVIKQVEMLLKAKRQPRWPKAIIKWSTAPSRNLFIGHTFKNKSSPFQ